MKKTLVFLFKVACLFGVLVAAAYAEASSGGIGDVASRAKGNLSAIAQLITAASYVAGMAFVVGAVVKFKAHKDNPTQIPIGTPIALLFVGAALLFIPGVFKSAGGTLFASGQGTISGVTSF